MSYFEEVVLPSVRLPRKGSYTIQESIEILGVSRATFYRRIDQGKIIVSPDKRIYYKVLEDYFSNCETK